MRIPYALLAFFLWIIALNFLRVNPSDDMVVLSLAIVAAGALAGGDDK